MIVNSNDTIGKPGFNSDQDHLYHFPAEAIVKGMNPTLCYHSQPHLIMIFCNVHAH